MIFTTTRRRILGGSRRVAVLPETHILNPPPQVLPGVTATKTLGVSKAIRHPSAGRLVQVRGLDTPPVPRRATFIYKSNPARPPAVPPAQAASLTPASLLLRVGSPHREMSLIRAGLFRRRGRRRLFRAMRSKRSTYCMFLIWLFIFTDTTCCWKMLLLVRGSGPRRQWRDICSGIA